VFRYFDLTPDIEVLAMLKLIGPILLPRWWQVVAVLGLAASVTLALTGTGSAEPPNPCFGYGF
jgi:hypothetical protein